MYRCSWVCADSEGQAGYHSCDPQSRPRSSYRSLLHLRQIFQPVIISFAPLATCCNIKNNSIVKVSWEAGSRLACNDNSWWRILSYGIWRRVALVRINASIIWVKTISTIGTALAVRSVLQLLVTCNAVSSALVIFSLMMEATHSSEMSILTRDTRRTCKKTALFIVTAVKISKS
jgi:hypothetical protein